LLLSFNYLLLKLQGRPRGTADAAWKSVGGAEGGMPVAFQLENTLPGANYLGGDLIIKTGDAAGKKLFIPAISGDKIILGNADAKVLAQIKVGDEVYLITQIFLRHKLIIDTRCQSLQKNTPNGTSFVMRTGKPIYPQRLHVIRTAVYPGCFRRIAKR
jgi:hypothetical protein